jgi:putative PIN family toxin of toxin-antitoxin system
MRVVLDTNVLVSALLFRGRLARLVTLWQAGTIVPVLTRETFAELRTVLSYPKFALTEAESDSLIQNEILPWFEVVEIAGPVPAICRDPDDDIFLAVAAAATADWLVTGDADLLALGSYQRTRIATPQEFLSQIGTPQE